MSSESVAGRAATLARLKGTSAGLQLLRKDSFAFTAAVLAERLGGAQRVRPAAEFLDLLDADLSALRDQGFDLPRTPQEYLADWVAAGIVVRRPGEAREETVEVSASVQTTLRFIADLVTPRSAVTSSRLSNVADLLASLARDSDPDPTSYIDALRAERKRLDKEIAEAESGRYRPLSTSDALERLAEIMRLANEVPGDFARVRDDLEHLNKNLRERIVQQSGARGDVLDQVFSDVMSIDQSDAGRSFNAFYGLVLDPERANSVDDAVDAVLSRDFALTLTDAEVAALRRWLNTLQAESGQVRAVMTGLAASLRRFVESHAYREHRRLADALTKANLALLEAMRQSRPQTQTTYELELTSAPLSSITAWTLFDPNDTRIDRPVLLDDDVPLDLEDLRARARLSEIDFDELRAAVFDVLTRRSPVSISQVLDEHPATQGLASVIGLLVLAGVHGTRTGDDEELHWMADGGVTHHGVTGRYIFEAPWGQT